MNRRTDETSENKILEQAKRSVAGKNMDEQEVKETVLKFVDSLKYRQIAQIPFTVNNRVRRFSISQISNLVNERDRPVEEDEGSLAAKAFQLFETGKGPVQAVVELKIRPDDAKEHYKKWVEMKEQDLSAPSVPRRLKELESTVNSLENTQIFSIINSAIGCGNPNCSGEQANKLEVDTVCSECGTKRKWPVNWE